MVHFVVPIDLLHIVLSKLPVKSLLRLRCVSKLWLKVIDSSYFIDMHLTQTAKTSSITVIVPSHYFRGIDESKPMYVFEFDNHFKARKIEPPVVEYDKNHVHTCNGLISLSTEDSFVIWNPATNKHRVVDKYEVIVDAEECRSTYYGFGYDHKTDDYKVVMFVKKLEEKTLDFKEVLFGKKVKKEEKCYIYSLKTGSWRKAGTPIHEIRGVLAVSVYANGTIYWIDIYTEPVVRSKLRMVALDLTTEKWLPLTMPPGSTERSPIKQNWSLSNHHGFVYASCCDDETLMVDLWVMKYQETKNNTWTKLFTIKGSFLCKIIPLWSLNKTRGHQVLIHGKSDLHMYDIEQRRKDAFDVLDVMGSGIWQSVTCCATLVSV